MIQVWFYSIISVLIVSLISLMGVFTLSLGRKTLQDILLLLVSFAAGSLFGDAFIHLIPESFEKIGQGPLVSLLIICGILVFFVLERFLRWRHCHVPSSSEHPHPVVALNLVGDAAHNLVDGMVIAASYMVSIPLGIATTIAVVLHEIPQELGEFGVLVHGGLSVSRALAFNFLSALFAVLGALVILVIGARVQALTIYLLPITAGGFIYIAGSDLIPSLHQKCTEDIKESVWQFIFIVAGILLMALLLFLEI